MPTKGNCQARGGSHLQILGLHSPATHPIYISGGWGGWLGSLASGLVQGPHVPAHLFNHQHGAPGPSTWTSTGDLPCCGSLCGCLQPQWQVNRGKRARVRVPRLLGPPGPCPPASTAPLSSRGVGSYACLWTPSLT